ncbi:MAG TPA: hypothetical protein VG797_05470 [Phycisphaerales bacterium]|nr:hypothetical protein [Phycisphaerales bacterium]
MRHRAERDAMVSGGAGAGGGRGLCVVLFRPRSGGGEGDNEIAPPRELMSALREKGLRVLTRATASSALTELVLHERSLDKGSTTIGEPSMLLVVEPGDALGLQLLTESMEKYAPHAVAWKYESRATPKLSALRPRIEPANAIQADRATVQEKAVQPAAAPAPVSAPPAPEAKLPEEKRPPLRGNFRVHGSHPSGPPITIITDHVTRQRVIEARVISDKGIAVPTGSPILRLSGTGSSAGASSGGAGGSQAPVQTSRDAVHEPGPAAEAVPGGGSRAEESSLLSDDELRVLLHGEAPAQSPPRNGSENGPRGGPDGNSGGVR